MRAVLNDNGLQLEAVAQSALADRSDALRNGYAPQVRQLEAMLSNYPQFFRKLYGPELFTAVKRKVSDDSERAREHHVFHARRLEYSFFWEKVCFAFVIDTAVAAIGIYEIYR